MGRVLKPGGVIGIRAPDHRGQIIAPANKILEDYYDLRGRIRQHHGGGDMRFGGQLRNLLHQAGFVRIKTSASYDYFETPAATGALALSHIARLKSAPAFEDAAEAGWVDRPTLERMLAAWQTWGEHPEAFCAMPMGEAVGWKE
jgi:hypothetical protein